MQDSGTFLWGALAMFNICGTMTARNVKLWSLCGCLLRDFSAQKIGFLCKEKWFSFCRLWISSGDTAGNPANCFQIRSEMGLLLQRRHFAFLSHIECIDLKLWLTWLQIDINYQSLWLPAGTSLQRRLLLVSWQTTGWLPLAIFFEPSFEKLKQNRILLSIATKCH